MSDLSWLNPTPHAIAVYASQPLSPAATQHSLPSGRYSLLGPDFHRLDRASFAWRTHSITSSATWRAIKRADRIRDTRQRIHSMISSATDRNESGTVRPIVLAALRLTINSTRIGTSTGRSAGLAPLKILSISLADCLYTLGRFAP